MNIKSKLFHLFSLVFITLVLQGCNGASGENGDDPFGNGDTPTTPTTPVNSVTLAVLDESCTNAATATSFGGTLCIQASLTQDGVPLTSEIIEFTSTLGSFDVDSKLTDSQGIAQVTLLTASANLGAGQITATFTSSGNAITGTGNFEILAATEVPVESAQMSLALTDINGTPANRVSADNTLAVAVTVLDSSGQPIVDQKVDFQATIGVTTPSSSLTNTQGVAATVFAPDERLGAGTITASTTVDDVLLSDALNVEVQASDVVNDDVVRLGVFEDGTFIEGALGIDSFMQSETVSISAGGTIGLNVALADSNSQPITTNVPVSFTSTCAAAADADIDETVLSINGIARSTYQDLSCAGGNGNDDIITASISLNGQQFSVTRVITLEAEAVGSIRFIDAQPNNIVLAGTGGQNADTVSTVTFQVNGALGNPLPQQAVDFSLNTQIGDLSLTPVQALTNSEGQVSTRVSAGTVPTSVRVTATTLADGTPIQSQSDLLSVNTGLPDQNSIAIAPDDINPEAFNVFGREVTVTARLADSFNNPVPDGTAVSFTAEAGDIEGSCTTTSGACSVIWTSGAGNPVDHRVTILATAIGHETLYDSNGNNQYETEDGPGVTGESGSGLDSYIASETGFVDLPEAWLDENENGIRDNAEDYLDFDSSGDFSAANGVFDGPQCASDCGATSLHVRKAFVLIMSSSNALMSFVNDGDELANNSSDPSPTPVVSIARNDTVVLQLFYSDTAGQPIPSASTIEIQTGEGELTGEVSTRMPQTSSAAPRYATVILKNNLAIDAPTQNTTVDATITTPGGTTSSLSIVVTLL